MSLHNKNTVKRALTTVLSLLLFLTVTSSAAQASDKIGKEEVLKKINESTELTAKEIDASELPEGVVPKKINNETELKEYLAHIEYESKNAQRTSNVVKGSLGGMTMALATTKSDYRDFNWCGGLHYVRMWVTYNVNGNIVSSPSNVSSSNNGWTLDSRWTQNSYYYSRLDSGRTLQVTVIGTMKHYLVADGLIEISSQDVSHTGWFYK